MISNEKHVVCPCVGRWGSKEDDVRPVLCLLTVVSLLAARGCPSGGPEAPSATLLIESKSKRDLLESSSQKTDSQFALGKVMARLESSRFRADVANSLGVSPETLGKLTLQAKPDARFAEVKAELADQELAVRVVNAAARRLADDFRNDPDVRVSVVAYARRVTPAGTEK
jgi:hypothetical protein